MTPLIRFLRGTHPDTKGRVLDDILVFSDVDLESDHTYIQWLFPLETMSENVSESPILTREEIATIKESEIIQQNIQRALERMTVFYSTTDNWLEEDNHNHLRITRILKATDSLLGKESAQKFYELLLMRIAETEAPVSPYNMEYWKEAVGLTLKKSTKMYLDIDGTMIHEDLTENYGKPARGLESFLVALRLYDTFWLTTHCKDGDVTQARRIMKGVLSEEYHEDIDRIQGTVWDTMKTEALDWNSDFIWFDNDIFAEERKALEKCGPNQSVLEVDLRTNPRQLEEIVRDVL